jgi:hypothetical protein
MAIVKRKDDNHSPGSGWRTPRFLRLKKASPKRIPNKSGKGGTPSPRSILSQARSRADSSPSPGSTISDDAQQLPLLPAIVQLSQRLGPSTPAQSQEHQHKHKQPLMQQRPPDTITVLSPLPSFERIVPHQLPFPSLRSGDHSLIAKSNPDSELSKFPTASPPRTPLRFIHFKQGALAHWTA